MNYEYELISCRVSKFRFAKKFVRKYRHSHLSLVADNVYFSCAVWNQLSIYLSPAQLTLSDRELLLRLLPVSPEARRKVLDLYKSEWIIGINEAAPKRIMMAFARRRANDWLIENYDNQPTLKPKTSNHFDKEISCKAVKNISDLHGNN